MPDGNRLWLEAVAVRVHFTLVVHRAQRTSPVDILHQYGRVEFVDSTAPYFVGTAPVVAVLAFLCVIEIPTIRAESRV